MLILIVAVVVLLASYFLNQTKRPYKYPPGPSWLPVVGNLPELKKLSKELGGQYLALGELAKRYKTNVLGLKLGKDYFVVTFSYNTVKTVFLSEEYEGRPNNFFIKLRNMGSRNGVTCTDGTIWKIHRSFVMTHLRTLGYGKSAMDTMIQEEVAEVITILGSNTLDIQIGKILAPAVLNVLWSLTTGSRFSRKDYRLNKLLDLLGSRSKAFDMSGGTLNQHPWLRFIAPEQTGYNLIRKLNAELKELLMETINYHYKTWSAGKNDDFIYTFITQMKEENSDTTTFTDEQLVMVCLDIFIAGAQTTSNTLDFAFLAMILHQDVQAKLQNHIDEVFPDKTQMLVYSDRYKLPYVEAVLLEIYRYFYVVPIDGPRRVLKDTILEKFHIPKDTTVLMSLYSIHYDKEYWGDPEVFRPERFLDKDGKFVNNERVIPFGLGRRRCLGENLARNCVFTFFTEVMRRYRVSTVPGTKLPTGIPLPGITLTPESYRAKFTPR